jgi:putative transposase
MVPLSPDTSYHIFNHANGFENIFRIEGNFNYFLEKYRLYISPIAETYAYCLMPNHFHLVLRIRKRETIEALIRNNSNNISKVSNFGNVVTTINDSEIEKYLSKQFANLFSSYTQSFNKVYHRMGSLFIKNFKRKPISDKTHFLNEIVYTHRNPIHHGFCEKYEDWEYCSYHEIVEGVSDLTEISKLLKITDGMENFRELHQLALDKFTPNNELEI